MQQLQDIFNRIRETKKEQKVIRDQFKDALANSGEYAKIKEDLDRMRLRKKQIENQVREEFGSDFEKLDKLSLDVKTDNEMLSDIALNQLVKGEEVAIVDEAAHRYEPIFSVRFKKID